MPEYKNNSSREHQIPNLSGNLVTVRPGQTIQTYNILNLAGVDKINDQPYYNPVLQRESLVFAGEEVKEVAIALGDIPNARSAQVWKVTGCNVSVFLNAEANAPAAAVLGPTNSTIIELYSRVEKLVLKSDGAGTCEVVITKEVSA